jgi:hypothetical protein
MMGDVAEANVRKRFDERMSRVLHCKSVQITAKALQILLDNPNTYCTARTLSEVRPVFNDELEPQAAVILHHLKLVYHKGPDRQREELFVALDRDALEQLHRVLSRAIAKNNKLETTGGTFNFRLL